MGTMNRGEQTLIDQPWVATRLVVADVEGNGQQPANLVELAVVPIVDWVISDPTTWIVRPPTPITWQATRVHGITNQDVANLHPLDAVEEDIRAHLGDGVLVAHNAHIKLDVLAREVPAWQPPAVIDTLKLARRLLPGLRGHTLGDLVSAFGLNAEVSPDLRPHHATYNALVTAHLLVRLAAKSGSPTVAQLVGLSMSDPPAAALF